MRFVILATDIHGKTVAYSEVRGNPVFLRSAERKPMIFEDEKSASSLVEFLRPLFPRLHDMRVQQP